MANQFVAEANQLAWFLCRLWSKSGFEVFTAMKIQIILLLVVTSYYITKQRHNPEEQSLIIIITYFSDNFLSSITDYFGPFGSSSLLC